MGENIQILSLSYDANIFGVNDNITDIGKNLIESLVGNQRWNTFLPNSFVPFSWKYYVLQMCIQNTFPYFNVLIKKIPFNQVFCW